MDLKISDIIAAQKTLDGIAKKTTLSSSKSFSQLSGANIFLKLENMQSTGSFKVRGAYNKIANLSPEAASKGVVAASAGNHAQGVAYSASKLGLKSTIFMPIFTPPLKVIATKAYGAEVVLTGETFDDAFAASQQYCKENNATYIHPFDDPYIIAGQGTVGLEIYTQLPNVDAVIVPIGGGGLIAGISLILKHFNPAVKIIGVQAEGAPSMVNSIKKGEIISLDKVSTIADGIAVKRPGNLNYDLVTKFVDELITVNDTEIARATYLLLQRAKMLAEPAGVTSVAAVLSKKLGLEGKNVVAVVSGGNINMRLLAPITEKGMVEEGLRACIQVLLPDQSGELKKLLNILDEMKANIQNIEHERSIMSVPIGFVLVTLTFSMQDPKQINIIIDRIKAKGLDYKLLS